MKPLLAFSNIPPFLSSNAMVLLAQSMADSDSYHAACCETSFISAGVTQKSALPKLSFQ